MVFTRTEEGQIAKYKFEKRPLIWVEGPNDYTFYSQLIGEKHCKIEAAGGVNRCWTLANAMRENDYPYIVIIDGHYHFLKMRRSPHRRIIILQRYSHENYFLEKNTLITVCNNYSRSNKTARIVGKLFDKIVKDIESKLLNLVTFDIANQFENIGFSDYPLNINQLLSNEIKLTLSNDKIRKICNKAELELPKESIQNVAKMLTEYLSKSTLANLIRGQLVFSVIRKLIIISVEQQTGKKPNIDNFGLRVLLSSILWKDAPTEDHKKLKRKIIGAINEIRKRYIVK